ncbi:MAG: glycosyltransferase family 39 protein [Verrucomicrobia bacterium]|nr:MAG: glycosyltransferase family 39 protein [Verrucomicrobiota bacterium]
MENPGLTLDNKSHRWVIVFLGGLVMCRLLLLLFAPMWDPSEARYAEMSRVMVQSGDWITPHFAPGVPFWAKPPLSMWASAAGIACFGPNHFGARIFTFLAALGLLAMVARAARHEFQSTAMGWVAAALLMASPLFYYCSAAVMTDLFLVLGTTLTMVAFRLALETSSRAWGYGFFVGLSIGLLAKGPLTLVLAGPPIFVYCLFTCQWRQVWQRIPWFSGTLLMLLVSVPWYLLAENHTPGFLDYFIVGEHIRRFTVAAWAGDKYGSAHSKPIGTIWLFALLATFPWCCGLLAAPLRQWRHFRSWLMAANGRCLYLLLWALWPLVFFTQARNIIATYPLPALPAIALLLTEIYWRRASLAKAPRWHPLHPALVGVSATVVLLSVLFPFIKPRFAPGTERELVHCYQAHRALNDRLLYFQKRKFSAEFYTCGQVGTIDSLDVLEQRMQGPGRLFLAIDAQYFAQLPPTVQASFSLLGHWGKQSTLYQQRNATPHLTIDSP